MKKIIEIIDWIRLPAIEFCEKYGHKVEAWDQDTSGNGRYGNCARCPARVHEEEQR